MAFLLTSCTGLSTPVETRLPSLTKTSPLPSATLPVTASSPETKWGVQCIKSAASFPSDFISQGAVVLNQREMQGISHTFQMDMKTGVMSLLAQEDEYLVGIAVSPDRKWLAYGREPINNDKSSGLIYYQNRYGVMALDGSHKKEFTRKQDWHSLSNWLDQERLIFGGSWSENTEDRTRPLIILNPFTGQEQKLLPNFPNIYSGDYLFPVPEWENYIGDTTYDASLTRAVYARIEGKDITGYVLWDLQVNKTLAFLPSPYLNQTPKWSLDNSQVLIVAYLAPRDAPEAKPELFSISRDGVTEQLTNFSSSHKAFDIASYSWSPNERYVAFWYDTREPFDERLAILDMTTGEVTDDCIQGDLGGSPTTMFDLLPSTLVTTIPPPIWSPDGQQLIVENRYAENASRLILIDIKKGIAAQIAENMMPVGWMEAIP